ncbi:hypothetical protein AB0G79_28280 [Streptomyces sp. NPDC020807]|uniref:hypothetical protein n=1 Tax=Streptomyces sp. NPDC020807 TaxID=3155119 RepID=UPI0033FECFCA
MATKKYTVTLPEELAEEIRAKVGPGEFSAYVTQAIQRQREQDRLGELVAWMVEENGPLTDEERAAADAEFRENERWHREREAREIRERAEAALPEAPTPAERQAEAA